MEDIRITEENISTFKEYMELCALNSSDICGLSYRKIMARSFKEGLLLLNEAIRQYPDELRLWNNRSVCYCELGMYIEALKDGQEMAVRFPGEIKSYYRMAEAYRGLKRYKDAIVCYQEVLKRDRFCVDAAKRLRELTSKNINETAGGDVQDVVNAVPSPSEIGGDVYYSDDEEDIWKPVGPVGSKSSDRADGDDEATVNVPAVSLVPHASAASIIAANRKRFMFRNPPDHQPITYSRVAASNCNTSPLTQARPPTKPPAVARSISPTVMEFSGNTPDFPYVYAQDVVPDVKDPCTDPNNPLQASSIWIGNVYKSIDKDMLYPHFQKIGNVINIVVYHAQTCAFVNFENPRAAGRAMRELQGLTVNGIRLLLRYPDRFTGRQQLPKTKTQINVSDQIKKFNKKYQNGKN